MHHDVCEWGRICRYVCRCAALLLALGIGGLWAGAARGALITETYTGIFQFSPGPGGATDVLGLNGASFQWKGTFDTAAPRVFTNSVNLDRFMGNIVLMLTGTAGNDGSYTPAAPTSTSGELYGSGGNDQFQLSNDGYFVIAGQRLNVGVILVPAGFTGAVSPSNTFTPFSSANVISYQPWNSINNTPNPGDPPSISSYSVINPQVSFVTVPEPASLGLCCAAGVLALRRTRRSIPAA